MPDDPYRVALFTSVSEQDFQATVMELAKLCGWLAYHPFDSRRSPEGYPDCTLVRAPRVVFAELKTEKGKATPHQQAWLAALRECSGVECYLWRPSDMDQITAVLRGAA